MDKATALRGKQVLQDRMIAKVEDVLMQGSSAAAPAYTLILGAGASAGIVPTVKQMLGLPDPGNKQIHEKSIPVWLATRRDATPDPDARVACCREFWDKFRTRNSGFEKCGTILFDDDGLPDSASIAAAYQAVFDTACVGGLDTPEKHVEYLRAVTMDSGSVTRLNATHFFLASLLSLQGRGTQVGAGKAPLYRGRRPFARTIFTTNFDPLLQTSLQLFQLLYYMTDRPEFLPADALYTDSNPSIHLFYAHGSVHRAFVANTDAQIELLKRQNAQALAGYLSGHGIIVLGYSGWDDCLLQALRETRTFSNNLYWLTRNVDNLSDSVVDFLRGHPNAYWVPIEDGGCLMAALHCRLCPGAPNTELLYNPITRLLSQLDSVSLTGIASGASSRDVARADQSNAGSIRRTSVTESTSDAPRDVETIRCQVVEMLRDVERRFSDTPGPSAGRQELEHQAGLSYANHDWESALVGYQRLLDLGGGGSAGEKALATFRRGVCWEQKGDIEKAIEDYTAVIDMPGAPAEQVAKARNNRGVCRNRKDDIQRAIEDYTAVIDMLGAPADCVARARFNRAVCWYQKGEILKAIDDYTATIEIPEAQDGPKARFNRGFCWHEDGDIDRAIADYTAVIETPGIHVDLAIASRLNRAGCWHRIGHTDEAIADYDAVISMPDASAEQVAQARSGRATCWFQTSEFDRAIAECTKIVEMPHVPVELIARALIGRGAYWDQTGDIDKGIADYTAVIDMPDAPADCVARARLNRAIVQHHKGEIDRAIADCTLAIEMQRAPAELVAASRVNRGAYWEQKGDIEKAIEDYTAVIDMPGAPADQLAKACLNRGIVRYRRGEIEQAIADSTGVIEMQGAPTHLVAMSRVNRAICWSALGHIDRAVVDYVAVIDMPGAPADQVAKAEDHLRLIGIKRPAGA